MSKRIVALLCAAAMLLAAVSLTGCGAKSTKTEVNGIKIEEQQYHSSYGGGVLLLLENKTGHDCNADITVKFMDEENKEVSSEAVSVTAFAKNSKVAKTVNCSDDFVACTYEVEQKDTAAVDDQESGLSEIPEVAVAADKDLKVKIQKKTQGAFFSITNKGKYAASEIEYTAVFYKSGEIAYMTSSEVGSLNPGNTTNVALNTLMPYDQIKVYVHGVKA